MKRNVVRSFVCALALVLACTLGLSACSSQSPEDIIRESLTEELDELKSDSLDSFSDIIDESVGDDLELFGIDATEFTEAYLDGFEYEIGDIAVDEDAGTATAEVSITIKSMNAVMTKWSSEYQEEVESLDTLPTEEELYSMAGEMLMDVLKNVEPATSEVEFSYTQDDDGDWEADEDSVTSELTEALLS